MYILSLSLLGMNSAWAQYSATDITGGPHRQWQPGRELPIEYAELSTEKLRDVMLRPYFGLRYTEDRNVFWDQADKKSDSIITFAPGLIFRYGRTVDRWVELDYNHEWNWYDDFSGEDYQADHFGVKGNIGTAKSSFFFGDTYNKSRRDDNSSRARLDEEYNIVYGRIKYALSEKTGLGLNSSYTSVDYSTEQPNISNPIDYTEFQIGPRFYYRVTEKADIYAEYAIGFVELDNNDTPGDYGDAEYHQISLGVNGDITEKTTTHGKIGYQRRTFEGDIDTIEQWTAGIGLKSDLSYRFKCGFDLVSGITPSITDAGHSVHTVRVAPYLSRDIYYDYFTATLSGAYERARIYEEDGERDDYNDYWEISALVDWHPLKHMTLGVGYVYQKYENDRNQDDIDREKLYVRLNVSY